MGAVVLFVKIVITTEHKNMKRVVLKFACVIRDIKGNLKPIPINDRLQTYLNSKFKEGDN